MAAFSPLHDTDSVGALDTAIAVEPRVAPAGPSARGVAGLVRGGARWVRRTTYSRRESRFYRMPANRARTLPRAPEIVRDRVADLLAHAPLYSDGHSRREFLQLARDRLTRGEHVYTIARDGELLHYSWLIERQAATRSEFDQPMPLPQNSAMLYDDFTMPAARGRGYHTLGLRHRAREAAEVPGTEWVYISVMADNHPSRRNIEKAGFELVAQFVQRTVLGRRRQWSTCE